MDKISVIPNINIFIFLIWKTRTLAISIEILQYSFSLQFVCPPHASCRNPSVMQTLLSLKAGFQHFAFKTLQLQEYLYNHHKEYIVSLKLSLRKCAKIAHRFSLGYLPSSPAALIFRIIRKRQAKHWKEQNPDGINHTSKARHFRLMRTKISQSCPPKIKESVL